MTTLENSTFRRTDQFVETDLDGEIVLMNHQTGQFLSFSNTTRRIWELLDGESSADEIVTTLCAEYKVEEDVCRADVAPIFDTLVSSGIIEQT